MAEFLNALDPAPAREALHRCCAATRWVEAMLAHKPFQNETALFETADALWHGLDPADWLEAFAGHPRIGDRYAGGWSRDEQSDIRTVSAETAERLRSLNQRYEERFGHVFLLCATGRTADAMLAELERRLTNDPDTELREAAEEQRKITRLRLRKLVSS